MASRRQPRPSIRWDRLGRCALLAVLALVVVLYVGPMSSWVSTWRESRERQTQVQELERTNAKLRERRAQLADKAALEQEARRLGMVRAGEKAFVISKLPRG